LNSPSHPLSILSPPLSLLTLNTYHEELACERVDQVVAERLSKGELPKFGYGKLMERYRIMCT
jgi:hypothetical protein